MTTKTIRSITAAAIGFALAIPATAFACGGKDGRTSHFENSDKNHDGFLTQAEVGAQRWERIKVADVNNDNKVSKEELKQAFEGTDWGDHGDRFQKADKNYDGFLTQEEIPNPSEFRSEPVGANRPGLEQVALRLRGCDVD
jgi:hypothetical protein